MLSFKIRNLFQVGIENLTFFQIGSLNPLCPLTFRLMDKISFSINQWCKFPFNVLLFYNLMTAAASLSQVVKYLFPRSDATHYRRFCGNRTE